MIRRKLSSKKTDLYYIVENTNWSIAEDGKNIVGNVKNIIGEVTSSAKYISNDSYIHYGSFNVFMAAPARYKKRKGNKIIVTCFHIVDGDPRASMIASVDKYVGKWHTSCNITKNKLISYGVNSDKICVIPLGIDTNIYFPAISLEEREKQRSKIGIKKGQIVIGSFQKDGNGWDEGLEPKLIKGPDIFCDAVEMLSHEHDIFVLLSGPARGYVKKRLEQAQIPYKHIYMENAGDIAKLYRMIDIYIVASREEGGPKAILESMASGVPVISTKVGQAVDMMTNGENGFIVDIEDVSAITDAFNKIINDLVLREKIIKNGLSTAKNYELKKIAERYENELYVKD